MKKQLATALSKTKVKLASNWVKVTKCYLDLKGKPSIRTLIKFLSWLVVLIVETLFKIGLTKLIEFLLEK
ncbi:MAG: hypothetical protein IK018_05665 [Lachnospiraceae bacterium]|nr:hypothetical protein [Lachnospiraceae bacterium]